MKRVGIALFVLAPVLAVAQEKYTNADLKRPPRKDAYTNAEVAKLEPLPVTGGAATGPAVRLAAPEPDRAALEREARLTNLAVERDLIDAEIQWLEGLLEKAYSVGGGPNGWPLVGPDTSSARLRIEELRRRAMLVSTEMDLVRSGVLTR